MLRVTKLTDYATGVLTVLAARPGEVLSATELAEFTGLEPPTVSKVLKPLAQAGLVEGLRGVRGGYRLTRPALEISLFEVVEAMAGPLALTECSHDHHQCGMAPKCGARSSWRLINDVVSEALRDAAPHGHRNHRKRRPRRHPQPRDPRAARPQVFGRLHHRDRVGLPAAGPGRGHHPCPVGQEGRAGVDDAVAPGRLPPLPDHADAGLGQAGDRPDRPAGAQLLLRAKGPEVRLAG
ncbi:hypothetical protein G6F50_013726 [Rhizopus delemar]|uniref:SUF system Fe-S cluster assembly regulator n=1 Tax=Rhizopus delemar TaxID=936053 RepID=A0A9P6YEC0_9FUNG|nr:hypothetical protein G6F50_013726 [Rhizopus delemar]